jgi:MFS family permease
VAAVAATAGPPIGGLLIGLSWRWIFVINVPIGIAVLAAGRRILPEVRAERGARLPDLASAALVLAAVSLFVVATVQGSVWGWSSAGTITLFAAALVATALTLRRTLHHPNALIEKSLFQSRAFRTSTVALFLVFVSFSAWLLITVLFFENQWHYSPMRAGLAIAPGPGVAFLFAINARRFARRLGPTLPATIGTFALGAVGLWWFALAHRTSDYLLILPALLLSGLASGMTQAPLLAAVNTLPPDRATTGSAVLNMSRQIGSAVGVALLVALLATNDPHGLSEFHRGWVLIAVSGWGAMVAVLAGAVSARVKTSRDSTSRSSARISATQQS